MIEEQERRRVYDQAIRSLQAARAARTSDYLFAATDTLELRERTGVLARDSEEGLQQWDHNVVPNNIIPGVGSDEADAVPVVHNDFGEFLRHKYNK